MRACTHTHTHTHTQQNVNSTTHRNTDNTSSNSRGLSSRFNRPMLPSSDGSVPSAFGEPSCSSSLFGAGSAVVLVLGLEEVLQGNRGSCMLLCCPSPLDGRISRSSSKAQRQWCFPGRVHGFCMRSSTRPIPMQNQHTGRECFKSDTIAKLHTHTILTPATSTSLVPVVPGTIYWWRIETALGFLRTSNPISLIF